MNRRGFLGALLAAPVAAVAAVAAFKAPSVIQRAKYTWGSFHDGFGLSEYELLTAFRSCANTPAPDLIVTNQDFYDTYRETLRAGEARKLKVQSLRRLSREGSGQTRRRAFEKLRELTHPKPAPFVDYRMMVLDPSPQYIQFSELCDPRKW